MYIIVQSSKYYLSNLLRKVLVMNHCWGKQINLLLYNYIFCIIFHKKKKKSLKSKYFVLEYQLLWHKDNFQQNLLQFSGLILTFRFLYTRRSHNFKYLKVRTEVVEAQHRPQWFLSRVSQINIVWSSADPG